MQNTTNFLYFFFRLFPEVIASILSDSSRRERVLSHGDASDILRDAFSQTEAHMNHHYEVLCATLLMLFSVSPGHVHDFFYVVNFIFMVCILNRLYIY